jgi:mono/diheme cytochrome c family protein
VQIRGAADRGAVTLPAMPQKYRTTLTIWLLLGTWVAAPLAAGKVLFDKNCAGCHGKDGHAKTLRAKFNKARDLTEAQWQDGTSDEAILETIKAGRGKMPPFGAKLGEAQIEGLLRYVRAFKQ